jgi:hypothetical protein
MLMATHFGINKPPKTEAKATISLKVSQWVHIRYRLACWLLILTGWLMNCDIEIAQEIVDE